jgi:hypothetical protein
MLTDLATAYICMGCSGSINNAIMGWTLDAVGVGKIDESGGSNYTGIQNPAIIQNG